MSNPFKRGQASDTHLPVVKHQREGSTSIQQSNSFSKNSLSNFKAGILNEIYAKQDVFGGSKGGKMLPDINRMREKGK